MEGVRLIGGLMLLNAVLTKTQGGLTDGWTAPMVPNVEVRVGGEWDTPFVRGLTLNGRVVYTGSQYIDTTSPRRSLPGLDTLRRRLRATCSTMSRARPASGRGALQRRESLRCQLLVGRFRRHDLGYRCAPTFRLSLTADF